jgi:hypothetical protein
MSPSAGYSYHIYGVHSARSHSLFVDYLMEDVDASQALILQHIRNAPDETLHAWQERVSSNELDVFELEYVVGYDAAQEAVEFWRAYFRFLGEKIVEAGHVGDRLSE